MSELKLTGIAHVTDHHIRHGLRCNCWECPVALALAEAMPDVDSVTVSTHYIDVSMDPYGGACGTFATPRHVRDFIEAFDQEREVAPIDIDLAALKPYCPFPWDND